ncbi:MAG: tRNA lysidine(34) synthetase TilS, partial [Candidatus Babeliales bacterium]
ITIPHITMSQKLSLTLRDRTHQHLDLLMRADSVYLPPNSPLIVGLSGGPDSVFLLHVLHSHPALKNTPLIIAHLNHQWDACCERSFIFCRSLAASLNLTFESATAQNSAQTQEGGRRARYHFFAQLKKKYTAQRIAVGHHANDQQENFFIRLMRGTTLSGLVGMKARNKDIIRPLLPFTKQEILAYLSEHSIAYIQDSANYSTDFLRNRVRMHALPALKTCDDRFEHNFSRSLQQLQEVEDFLDAMTTNLYQQHTQQLSLSVTALNIIPLYQQFPQIIHNRVILLWLYQAKVPFTPSTAFLQEIRRFAEQGTKKTHHLHTSWALCKQNNLLYIQKL